MYSVLLVDDEFRAIETLQYSIDWSKLDIDVCGYALNALEAIDLVYLKKPDIIISDIKMPDMDGISLISFIKTNMNINSKFIIISGFSDFDYAKRAMRLEVKNYLLKPVISEELEEAVQNVILEIEDEKRGKQISEIENESLRNELVVCYLKGILDDAMATDIQKRWPIFSKVKAVVPILLSLGEINSVIEDEDRYFGDLSSLIKDSFTKIFSNNYIEILRFDLDIVLVFVGIKEEDFNKFDINSIYNDLEKVSEKLEIDTGVTFPSVVGKMVGRLQDVKEMLEKMRSLINLAFISENKSFISINDNNNSISLHPQDVISAKAIVNALQEKSSKDLKSALDELFNGFEERGVCESLKLSIIKNVYYQLELLNANTKREDFDEKYQILDKISRSAQLLEKTFRKQCFEYLKTGEEEVKKEGGLLERIESFISENYKRNFTIKEMSKKLFVHHAYLGQYFIQKFGISINEYTHSLRINEAKQMLGTTNKKIKDISEELGYSSYYLFLMKFEKATKMTPLEFRKLEQQKI